MSIGYARYLLWLFIVALMLAAQGQLGAAMLAISIVLLGFHLTNDSRKR